MKAITVNIGSNNELAAIKQCEDEVAVEFGGPEHKSHYGATPESATSNCIDADRAAYAMQLLVADSGVAP